MLMSRCMIDGPPVTISRRFGAILQVIDKVDLAAVAGGDRAANLTQLWRTLSAGRVGTSCRRWGFRMSGGSRDESRPGSLNPAPRHCVNAIYRTPRLERRSRP